METEVFSGVYAAVAAEILVDNVRIVAGTGLKKMSDHKLCMQRQMSLTSLAWAQSRWLHGHLIRSSASAEETRGRRK